MKHVAKNRGPVIASIIIPVFNKSDLTCQCLTALSEVTGHIPHEVIVVDDGSTDDTQERLKAFQGKIKVIANGNNQGFSKGCNQGAARAKGKYLVFLNNDTVPLRGWLDALVQEVETHANVAMVGSKLLYRSGWVQHAGVAFYRENRRPHHPYRLAAPDDPRVTRRRELQAVTAACVLIRPEWFVKCGRFDEEYITSYEDLELCLNIRRRHGTIVYQPKSVLYHLESQTPGRKKNDDRNAALFFRRWKNWVIADEDAYYLGDGYKMVYRKIDGRTVAKLARIVSEEERDRWAIVARCQIAAAEGQADEVSRLLQGCANWPCDPAIHRWAGVLSHRMELLPAARDHWRTALELEDSDEFRLELAGLASASEDLSGLGQTLTGKTAVHFRGITQMRAGDYAAAAGSFEEALFQGAKPVPVLLGQAAAALGLGDNQAARTWSQAVLSTGQPNAVATQYLSQLEAAPAVNNSPDARSAKQVAPHRTEFFRRLQVEVKSRGAAPLRVGVLSVEPPAAACLYLRLQSVLQHLQAAGSLEWVSLGKVEDDRLELQEASLAGVNVVVVQRQAAAAVSCAELRRKSKDQNQKIVFELDDAVTLFPEGHPGAAVFNPIRTRIEEYLRGADLVTVSTPELQSLYRAYNRNILVLPNSLDLQLWPASPLRPEPDQKIIILFSGTPTHARDLELVEPAMLDLLAAYPDQVEFHFWGDITKRLRMLPQVKPVCEFTTNYPEYIRLLRKAPVSFAIVPLEDSPCNRAKSPIKWLEYSMCRIPGIYSALPAYNHAVEHERTGLLVPNTREAWLNAMKMLVENPALRHQLAEQAQQSVLAAHTLEQNARAWLQAYESLFTRPTAQVDAFAAPGVSIVIPVFNHLELTQQCLSALKKNTRLASCEIIVVDNGSTDASPGFLKSEEAAGQLRLVRKAKNLGFAKACNQGASIARGQYVLFLNNDTEVQPRWLEPLLSLAENDPSIAAVGSKLLYPDGTIQHAGVALTGIAGRDPLMGMHTFSRAAADLPAANVTRVYQALTAACLLIRKSAFDAVSGFDEGFWNGYEDVDLCLRLQERGGLIVYEPASVVVHHESQSGPARFEKVQDNIRRLHEKWLGKTKLDVAISADETVTFLQTSPIRPYRVLPASQPFVSIIILAHNQIDHTRRCLESIERHTPEPHELILVDNGSTDGTSGYFRDYAGQHQHVTVIANLSNRGFAAGNNQGIAAARGEFILLLNNDTVVTASWLKKMLDVAQLQPDIGIVGPRSNRVLGNQLVDAPAYETLEELPAFAAQWAKTNDGQSRTANRVIGFCLLTKRAVIDRIGGLDEQFGSGNFEDDDFCIRAGLAGFETRIADEAFVHHVGNATFNGARIDYRQAMLANWSLFKAKWAIPADVPPQVGYQTPRVLPDGVPLNFPIPSLQTSHTLDAGGRFWAEKPRAAATARSSKLKSQHPLPDCARIGELGDAREKLRQKQLQEAWQLTVEAIAQRPFHPEAAMLLAEIALAAGDGASARQCAQHARDLAPGWSPPKQWLQKSHKANPRPEWLKLPSTLNSHRSTHLTVCIIARNEEKFLEQCLRSIKPIAAQIVLVDTGSTDRTVDIAKDNGAEVHSFTWCDDFAAARNAALERARGDWILILDADEQLPAEQHPKLQNDLRNRKALAYRMPLVNLGIDGEGVNYVPRLFRNVPGAFFQGRIHEQIFPGLIALSKGWEMETGFGTAKLLHHGYEKEVLRDRNKIERNLLLLRRAVEESPDDANLAMNLGLELIRSGDTANGMAHYREAFRLISTQAPGAVVPELREVLLSQFTTHLYKQREHDEVVRILTSPLAKNGGLTASLHFALGLSLFELKQYLDAAANLRCCLDKRNETTFSPASTDIHTSAPYHCLALSLSKLGDAAGAEKAFEAALKEPGRAQDVKLDLARFLHEQGRPVDALHRLHEIVAVDSQHLASWRLGGEIALSEPGFVDFANDWTGEASQAVPEDLVITAQRAEVLMLRQETDAARPLWKNACNGARPPRALAAWILCSTVEAKEIPSIKDSEEEAATSRAFVQWYQRLIAFGAKETLERVNTNLDAFRESLPTAAQLLNCALSEAAEPAAALGQKM